MQNILPVRLKTKSTPCCTWEGKARQRCCYEKETFPSSPPAGKYTNRLVGGFIFLWASPFSIPTRIQLHNLGY